MHAPRDALTRPKPEFVVENAEADTPVRGKRIFTLVKLLQQNVEHAATAGSARRQARRESAERGDRIVEPRPHVRLAKRPRGLDHFGRGRLVASERRGVLRPWRALAMSTSVFASDRSR